MSDLSSILYKALAYSFKIKGFFDSILAGSFRILDALSYCLLLKLSKDEC